MRESPRLKERRRQHVAEREKRHRATAPRETQCAGAPRRVASAGTPPTSAVCPNRARHRRQLGRRHAHPEEAHRQHVQRLRVRERGERAHAEQTRDRRVDVAADLHDAAPDEHRDEIRDHRAHVRRRGLQHRAEMLEQREHHWQLHEQLQRASDHARPRGDAPRDRTRPRAAPSRCSAAMIARFQTIGAEYERRKRRWLLSTPRHHAESTSSPAPGKENAHECDRELALRARKSRRDEPDEPRRDEHSQHARAATSRPRAARPRRPPRACAASSSPSARSRAYTGMNDAESTPSPKRFCRKFGMRNAALNASAASPSPR